MDDFEEFVSDAEVFHKVMERYKRLGIINKEKIIIEMEKEIDEYRRKIQYCEELARTEEKIKIIERAIADVKGSDSTNRDDSPEGSDGAGGCTEEIPYIKKILPDKVIDRMTSMTIKEDGDMFIYFAEVDNGDNK